MQEFRIGCEPAWAALSATNETKRLFTAPDIAACRLPPDLMGETSPLSYHVSRTDLLLWGALRKISVDLTVNIGPQRRARIPCHSSEETCPMIARRVLIFVAIPMFGIEEQGWRGYLKTYIEPTVIMLPFNIISEVSRTLALAVRLFGNMMSGAMIIGILLSITPFLFPVVMTLLGLLTGIVQAYIFSILAAVYIAAATQTTKRNQ